MIIKPLSKTRGITMFYDGSKYIIWSECYGIVAESTKIVRTGDSYSDRRVEIHFDICEWTGYWDINPIITRGITKFENEFVPKKVVYIWNKIDNEQNSLHRRLVVSTEKY